MTDIKFSWIATFKNGTIVKQFDNNGKEELFKNIEESPNKISRDIKELKIVSNNLEYYTIDPINKTIDCNGKRTLKFDSNTPQAEIIYRRRNNVRVTVGSGEVLDPRTTYIIGLKDNINKIEINIFPGLKMMSRKIEIERTKDNKKTKEDITNL